MNSDMEFGVLLPTLGHHASQEAIRQLATTAENCDFDAVWAGDHVTFPAEIPDEYPFSPTGESPFHISQNAYDLFGVLNYLAGITDDVEIGSSTCIVPYRHPVVLARNALTVEALSDGRFDFGVGTGWMHTEFEVLDVPFEERGNRTDEFLELFEQLREDGSLSFDGPTTASKRLVSIRYRSVVGRRYGLAADPVLRSVVLASLETGGPSSGIVRQTSLLRGNESCAHGRISTALESQKSHLPDRFNLDLILT